MKKKHLSLLISFVVLLCAIVLFSIIGNCLPNDIETKAEELKEYCVKNNYNTNIGVLVDYSVHSGRTRFVVWDFNNNKALLDFSLKKWSNMLYISFYGFCTFKQNDLPFF